MLEINYNKLLNENKEKRPGGRRIVQSPILFPIHLYNLKMGLGIITIPIINIVTKISITFAYC